MPASNFGALPMGLCLMSTASEAQRPGYVYAFGVNTRLVKEALGSGLAFHGQRLALEALLTSDL